MRFACDTGGTFTDLVIHDESGVVRMFKTPTTPHDPVDGILEAVKVAADQLSMSLEDLLGRCETFVHGTTHAINAIITGKTAKTALLTTKGHPDILVFREGGREDPFNTSIAYPKPYVPRSLTFEVSERVAWDGAVLEPLDESALLDVIGNLETLGVETVAVCLLWSTVNPTHEDRVGNLLTEHLPGVPYTLSHRLNPILREYRRASSTAIDASLKPLMSKYVGGLAGRLERAGFRGRLLMLTSKGGVMDAEDLAQAPIHVINSGPSMAPIAGYYYAEKDTGDSTAIIADTGGTTYDVSLVRRGVIPMTPDTWIGTRTAGHIIGFPSVAVKSIGAGGGSIAKVDEGGLLRVGPDSAGAVPGPACYGKGGARATVTDASLVLGHIDPEFFLGGTMQLDFDKAAAVIDKEVARPLRMNLLEAASAVLRLATENMVSAIEQITIHQGVDPRGSVLVGGGGAAGLNSVNIARRLGCSKVLIPEAGAALSAVGALISDLHADYRALYYTETTEFDFAGTKKVIDRLTAKCEAFFAGPGAGSLEKSIEYVVEARYRAQIWEIDVPLQKVPESNYEMARLRRSFDDVHEELFGYHDAQSPVQFIGWRATAKCRLSNQAVGRLSATGKSQRKLREFRESFFPEVGKVQTRVFNFESLGVGPIIVGPAIVESPFTTVVIDPGAKVLRTDSGSIVIAP
jgi:N-methylhydantoinase A